MEDGIFPKLLYIGSYHLELLRDLEGKGFYIEHLETVTEAQVYVRKSSLAHISLPEVILLDGGLASGADLQAEVVAIQNAPELMHFPIVMLGRENQRELFQLARKLKLDDVFIPPFPLEAIDKRLLGLRLTNTRIQRIYNEKSETPVFRLPLWKRTFDVLGASLIILMLSPLFLLVMLLIRLESKGPIFYTSQRVGTGYRIFGFYKFRSMRVNADAMLDKLKKENNQYAQAEVPQPELVSTVASAGLGEEVLLIQDDDMVSEFDFLENKKTDDENAFVKIENDPRITKVGKFIRNSSIDELPQLFNVLKGDMSLVGNRPLPLYEAEKLTSDDYSLRFMAPAGITGLWQVMERGSSDVSSDNRKKWDIDYAQNFNLWMDLKILLKTIPAVIQKANV